MRLFQWNTADHDRDRTIVDNEAAKTKFHFE